MNSPRCDECAAGRNERAMKWPEYTPALSCSQLTYQRRLRGALESQSPNPNSQITISNEGGLGLGAWGFGIWDF